jgi:hypothetical protein
LESAVLEHSILVQLLTDNINMTILTGAMLNRGLGRSLTRQASKASTESAIQSSVSPTKIQHATKMIMKMFMRAGLVEGVFARLIPLCHAAAVVKDTATLAIHAIFEMLGVACDIEDLSSEGLDRCFVGPDGVFQFRHTFGLSHYSCAMQDDSPSY